LEDIIAYTDHDHLKLIGTIKYLELSVFEIFTASEVTSARLMRICGVKEIKSSSVL
jgi:hypothetical protein